MTDMTATSYNRYSRWLHWLIAGLILFMVFLGWRLGDHDSMRLSRVNLHKSIGISILLLSFVRLALRFVYKAPPEPPMPKWQAFAAQALHVLFYVFMIGMPLTGWAMVSTSAREIPFFGLFPWPHLPVPQNHDTHEFFEAFHVWGAKILIYGMIPLHVLAALKHQFVDKDTVVEHMVPGLTPKPILNWRWIVPLGVVILAVAFAEGIYRGTPEKGGEGPPPGAAPGQAPASLESGAASVMAEHASESVQVSPAPATATSSSSVAASTAAVTTWTVDKAATKIAFSTTFQGEAIYGGFSSYNAAIAFDPAQLDKSHVKVTIDLASVSSGDNDRDSTLKSDSFFNVGSTPTATYAASSFTKKDATHFVAHGTLTMHGTAKPVELPFTLTIANGAATMSGTVVLDRTAFGVGSGDYAATTDIPAKVNVAITLKAKAAK